MSREPRRNIFFRSGALSECLPRHASGRVRSVSGRFAVVREFMTRKRKGSTHWLVLELDADEYGPLTGIYFDARDFKAASVFVAMYRQGIVLKEGDDILVSAGKGGYPELSVNGTAVKVVPKLDWQTYESQEGTFVSLLDSIRGAHLEAEFRDEVELYCRQQVRDWVSGRIYLIDDEMLRRIVLQLCPPDVERDSSFEDIYLALKRMEQSKVINP